MPSCFPPSNDFRAVFHLKVQSRSGGQSTAGSKRKMVVVTQRERPGTGQLRVNGTLGERQSSGKRRAVGDRMHAHTPAGMLRRLLACQESCEARRNLL